MNYSAITTIGVEISCIAHATEDYNKVVQAILNTAPEGIRDLLKNKLSYEDTQGYYKDPIRIYRARLEKKEAQEYIAHIIRRLSKAEFEVLILALEERYDPRDGRLYIRISKQDAFRNIISLAFDDDVIRLVATLAGTRDVKKVEEFLRSLREV
ncbi:MAG: RNA-binding domain-containing protein [Sulfolobales archaeon]